MTRYAEGTSVSVERSKAEIEGIVSRYGADQFMSGWDGPHAMIGFQCHDRYVRFELELPARDDEQFQTTPAGRRRRTEDGAYNAWEQACRQLWRALALAIKAKLEAVECGIATFENEFMAQIIMPDGKTVADHVAPRIAQAYKTGKMPRLLPMLTRSSDRDE